MQDPDKTKETPPVPGKVYVGGFHPLLGEADLHELFAPFGEILSLRVHHKQSVFAHIIYADAASCARAVAAYEQKETHGVVLRVGEMKLDAEDRAQFAPSLAAVGTQTDAATFPSPFGGLRIHVVLVRPAYESNIGAVARLCANYAVSSLILVAPLCPVAGEAEKLARHGKHFVTAPVVLPDLAAVRATASLLVGFTARGASGKHAVRVVQPLSETVAALQGVCGDVALVFGNETNGLDRRECEACDTLTTIDIETDYPVLNLSHAVGIGLHQLHIALREGDVSRRGVERERLAAEKDGVLAAWLRLVDATLLEDHEAGRCSGADIMRRLLGRAVLTEHEAHALQHTLDGILHAIDK